MLRRIKDSLFKATLVGTMCLSFIASASAETEVVDFSVSTWNPAHSGIVKWLSVDQKPPFDVGPKEVNEFLMVQLNGESDSGFFAGPEIHLLKHSGPNVV